MRAAFDITSLNVSEPYRDVTLQNVFGVYDVYSRSNLNLKISNFEIRGGNSWRKNAGYIAGDLKSDVFL